MKNLLYLILLFTMVGCGYSSGTGHINNLDKAERMLHSDPVAALEVLNGFELTRVGDSAVIARWALLYSEAMVANDYFAPTDTIVNIAIAYYGAHRQYDSYKHACRLKALLSDAGHDSLASALYLQKEKEYMLYKERIKSERLFGGILLVILLSICAIIFLYYRVKAARLRNDALVAEAAALRNDFGAKLSSLQNSRFAVIDSLCSTYYESQGTVNERKAIAEKVKSHIAELQRNEGIFADMEQSVNKCYGNLLSLLRKQWPDISETDYRLAVYLACRLSSRTMAMLFNENIDVIYKRKSRLKAKICALNLPDRELFLSIF